MKNDEPTPEQDREANLDQLIHRYYEARERGESVDPEAFADANSDFARELRSFFADFHNVEDALQQPSTENIAHEQDSDKAARDSTIDSVSRKSNQAHDTAGAHVGDYQLLGEVGRGGMGVVFKAKQQNLDRIVALKMILGGKLASDSEVNRFYREAKAAAALKHPNIVSIHDIGSDRGCHFFAMDFVQGKSLADCLHEGAMEPQNAAELLEEIARAIEFAHSHGILHRDLKPGNILIDDEGQPRIVDFGLAKAESQANPSTDPSLTTTGQILGTPSYMPPEQATADHAQISATSDVYSMGAILYACLCGRAPFVAATTVETIRQVIENDPVAIHLLSPQVPKDLETICLKCLQKDPRSRFQSAGEFADDLRRFLDGRPIVARPVSFVTHGYRWARRNPWMAFALSLIVIVCLSGPILATHEVALRRQSDINARRATTLASAAEKSAKRAMELQGLAEERAESEAHAKQRALLAAQQARRRQFTAEMNLIGFHWELGNTDAVRQLHQSQIPKPEDVEDLREFTWGYWAQQLESASRFELGATPMSFAVHTRVSPDSQRVAFSGTRGQIHVRQLENVSSDDEFVLPILSKPKIILGLAFILDSSKLAVREATSIVIWDLEQTPPTHHAIPLAASMEGSLGRNTFSENGRYLTVTSANKTNIWDLVERDVVHEVELPVKPINLRHLSVSDDGSRLLTSTGMTWSIADSEVIDTVSEELYTNEVAPAPDGQGFIVKNSRGELAWWNGNGEKKVLAPRVVAFDVSLEAQEIAWATMRGVYLASTQSIDEPRVIHQKGILALSFDSNGKCLTGVSAERLYRWELNAVELGEPQTLPHWARGAAFARSPNGRYYAGHTMGHLCIWDTADGQLIQRTAASASEARGPITDDSIRGLAVSDTGRIATCSMRGDVDLWDGLTGLWIKTLKQTELPHEPSSAVGKGLMNVEMSANGEVIVATTLGGECIVWNLKSDRSYSFNAHAHFTSPPSMSPDGTLLSILRRDTNRRVVWDLEEAEWNEQRLAWSQGFLFNGRWALATSTNNSMEIWDSRSGELLLTLGGHPGMQSITATPDGTTIATLSNDGSLIIWDSRLKVPLLTAATKPGKIAFVDGGRVLSLIQHDGKIRLWKSQFDEVTD